MATGATAQITKIVGPHSYTLYFILLAVAEIIYIAITRLLNYKKLRDSSLNNASSKSSTEDTLFNPGLFTIPLGLAVVSTGLLGTKFQLMTYAGYGMYILSWISFIWLILRFLSPIISCRITRYQPDGGWFLIPAAGFGLGITTVAFSTQMKSPPIKLLAVIGIALVALSVLSYFALIISSGIRIRRFGISDTKRVLWWISAGCGGLGALSAVKQLDSKSVTLAPLITLCLRSSAISMWVTGTILLIPIAMRSTRYVFSLNQLPKNTPWPPTFSTAVFALGTLSASTLFQTQFLNAIGTAAGISTIILWIATVIIMGANKLAGIFGR